MLDPDLPTTVMQLLTMDEQENDDLDLEKVLKSSWGNFLLDLPIVVFLLDQFNTMMLRVVISFSHSVLS